MLIGLQCCLSIRLNCSLALRSTSLLRMFAWCLLAILPAHPPTHPAPPAHRPRGVLEAHDQGAQQAGHKGRHRLLVHLRQARGAWGAKNWLGQITRVWRRAGSLTRAANTPAPSPLQAHIDVRSQHAVAGSGSCAARSWIVVREHQDQCDLREVCWRKLSSRPGWRKRMQQVESACTSRSVQDEHAGSHAGRLGVGLLFVRASGCFR